MNHVIPALLLGLVACAELDPPTLIKRDRVLAAKVTVDTDPTRAWPARGETATVTWVTASPESPPTFSWILAACPAATSAGLPACAAPAFATVQSSGPVPTLQLAIPGDLAATAVIVTGAICASGTPSIDAATATAACDDRSRADLVSQHIFIATEDAANHNPDLRRAPFTYDGNAWEAGAGCDALPSVKPGADTMLVGVTFDSTDRETFSTDSGEARENLQLAGFATAGEILQRHAYVEADDDRPASAIAVEWEPPSADDVPDGGLRVKFHFVVRDMRGGVDATTRELCVR